MLGNCSTVSERYYLGERNRDFLRGPPFARNDYRCVGEDDSLGYLYANIGEKS